MRTEETKLTLTKYPQVANCQGMRAAEGICGPPSLLPWKQGLAGIGEKGADNLYIRAVRMATTPDATNHPTSLIGSSLLEAWREAPGGESRLYLLHKPQPL